MLILFLHAYTVSITNGGDSDMKSIRKDYSLMKAQDVIVHKNKKSAQNFGLFMEKYKTG